MQVIKVIVAISLGIMLALFFGELVTSIYSAPSYDSDKCKADYSSCLSALNQKCGTGDMDCAQAFYDSQQYKTCVTNAQAEATKCAGDFGSSFSNYQLISLIIFAVIGGGLLVFGFGLAHFETLSSGMILGGVLVFLSNVYSGLLSGVFGNAQVVSGIGKWVRIIVYLAFAVLLGLFAYNRLDKEGN